MNAFLASFVACALLAAGTSVGAQVLECRLSRGADASFSGTCATSQAALARLTLEPPTVGKGTHWSGIITSLGASPSPVEIDTIPTGMVRTARGWFALLAWQADSMSVRLRFSPDSAAVTDDDLAILREAREFLGAASRWNRADTTDMDAAPTRGFACAPARSQSMFCAVYVAALRRVGRYDHFRPAVNALRNAIDARGERYRHPLVDFNNAPSRSLVEVQAVLDSALAAVVRERDARGTGRRPNAACGRACLRGLADSYLDALVQRNPSRLPIAAGARFTENGAVLFPGEGLWRTASAVTGYRQYVIDSLRQGVAVMAVVREDTSAAVVLIRLSISHNEIREIETIVVRRNDNAFFDPSAQAALRPITAPANPSGSGGRDALVGIADAYFTALDTQGTSEYQKAPFAPAANRYENGALSTNVPGARNILGWSASEQFDRGVFRWRNVSDRRYPLVDEELGLVLAFATFRPSPVTNVLLLSEIFRIEGGMIHEIRAAMVDRPPGAPTGWP